MTTAQKIVKYLSVAFAVMLSATIIGGIVGGVFSVARIGFSFTDSKSKEDDRRENTADKRLPDNVTELDIKLNVSKLKVVNGDEFTLKYADDTVIIEQLRSASGTALKISEKDAEIFDNIFRTVELTVPADMVFDKIKIETDAGSVDAERINAKELDIDCDAGSVDVARLTCSDKADIEIDAGSLTVGGGEIGEFKCNIDAGKIDFCGKITQKAEFNSDVGSVRLALNGTENDYFIDPDRDAGSITVNGTPVKRGETVGSGNVKIDIGSGVGSVDIVFGVETE